MLLDIGWEAKIMKPLPWGFENFMDVKDAFLIKGVDGFTEEFHHIKRTLIWNENCLVIDTGKEFYYACARLPSKLIKKINNGKLIDVLLENTYNNKTEHHKIVFPCH